MKAKEVIKQICKIAGWKITENDFKNSTYGTECVIEFDNDLKLSMHAIGDSILLFTSKIFSLKQDETKDCELIEKASQLLLAANSEHSISGSVRGNYYQLEKKLNIYELTEDQILYETQKFLNDCDMFIVSIKDLESSYTSFYGNSQFQFMLD